MWVGWERAGSTCGSEQRKAFGAATNLRGSDCGLWSEQEVFCLTWQRIQRENWIRESSLEQVRKWYKADDCSSQSEFIEKAIHFYIGYISSENGSDYLPKIITSTVKGIVNDSDNRISRILFKLAVEQAITMNVVAATCNIGREQLEKLRGTCVAQVKRTNGVYSFEDAFDFQKR